MPRSLAPWWMFVIAASFLAFIVLIVYQGFLGPAQTEGLSAQFVGGGMVVKAVRPNSIVARIGLEPQDRILAVDGQLIRSRSDWQSIRANTEVERPQQWQILRAGKRLELTATFPKGFWTFHSPEAKARLLYLPLVLVTFAVAMILAFRRPNDVTARLGAWLLATASIGLGAPDGWAAIWRHFPALLGAMLWIPQISRFVFDGILLSFFIIFPARLFRARWPWIALWIPVLAVLPWRISAVYSVIYQPEHSTGAPEWIFRTAFLRTVVYLAGGVAVLVVSYRRLEDMNQKRRIRVLVAGVTVALLAVLAYLVVSEQGPVPQRWWWILLSSTLLFCLAFPLSFAYAILRHRLFDIRVMVRQGLQYALARGAVLSLVPVLAGALVLDLVLHSDQTLAEILAARGWIYAVLAGLAWVAHTKREAWLQSLDRRFFRERYDAQRILREVVEEVHRAGNFEKMAPQVVAKCEAALHPEFAALLVREPRQASFRTLAAAPLEQSPPPLAASTKLVALVRVLEKPLELSHPESDWLQQQLPHEETQFLREAHIDLLVPVATAAERREVLLALGTKRSQEPYSREDQDLLLAIAASLALLLERPVVAATTPGPGEAFEECPQCGNCYDTGAGRCAQDSTGLLPVHLPRLLAGRYRLERRRGRGGMGAVYEATDTALERRVAVKVIRDDLVRSAEAAERFRREAKASASFTHPNVVTVHDFGVAADTRAFLVMELLEGVTLREELKRQTRLAPSKTLEIMRGVTAAVEAAHRRLLIHRDLKPENVFLVRLEAVEVAKVLDFGVAKFLPTAAAAAAETATGTIIGTLGYMAPEQLRGGSPGPSWDLWALAVMVYEMLTGIHPFAGSLAREMQGKILAAGFTPIQSKIEGSTNPWQEFFARALALDPAQRPSSASMLFAELGATIS